MVETMYIMTMVIEIIDLIAATLAVMLQGVEHLII